MELGSLVMPCRATGGEDFDESAIPPDWRAPAPEATSNEPQGADRTPRATVATIPAGDRTRLLDTLTADSTKRADSTGSMRQTSPSQRSIS